MESVTNLSKAYNLNLSARRNDTFTTTLLVKESSVAVDLSEYTAAKMQLKENENADAAVTFTNTGSTYNINLSNLATGYVTVSASTLNIVSGSYLYDLELRNTTKTQTVVYGKFHVINDITK